MTPKTNGRRVGLIAGLGMRAGIYYYEQLVERRELQGHALDAYFAHADVRRVAAYVQAGERGQLAAYLAEFSAALAKAGADFLVVSAITPHICLPELTITSPLPIVSALEAINNDLRERRVHRVALFGTRYVVESDLFGTLTSAEIARPRASEIEEIHNRYMEIATTGQCSPETRDRLTALAHTLCAREHVDAIVLAGTDLSPFFDERHTDFPLIDSSNAHIQQILNAISLDET